MIQVVSLLQSKDGGFQPVQSFTERLGDERYIEGALVLKVDGNEIMGLEHRDYIDQLWAYLADVLAEFVRQGSAYTYFPDQPLKFVVEQAGSPARLKVSCGSRSAMVDRAEFIGIMKRAGLAFFENMTRLAPSMAEPYRQVMRVLESLPAG